MKKDKLTLLGIILAIINLILWLGLPLLSLMFDQIPKEYLSTCWSTQLITIVVVLTNFFSRD